ncbi:MAG: phage tail protein, partial [Alphaproteobacteria bacterium]|nr:phage tail protein [Alphaproteobacteria bacterium]
IPSLSFEVFADGSPVTLQAMVSDMAGPDAALNTLAPASFAGFSAEEASIGDAITTLTNAVPLRVWDDGVTLQMAQAVLTTTSVADNDLGTTADKAKPVKLAVTRKSASTIPQSLWIAYYDSARDYQKNTQTARRVAGARKGQSLNLPATLDAATAKTIAETKLSTIWAERATARLALPWRYLALEPGQTLLVPGSTDDWRISAITFNKMVLEVDLTRQLPASSLSYSASAGQVVTQFDAPAGPTALDLLDLPLLTDGVASAPFVAAAAAGASVGWSGVALSISTDGGASFTNAGTIGAASVLGVANSALPTSSAYLIDTQNSVTVQLLNTQMLLTDASDTLLLGGANAAMLGNELIQFGSAQPLGGGLWQLSRLLRGRRGTEFAISSHMVGDNFALLNPASMVQLP